MSRAKTKSCDYILCRKSFATKNDSQFCSADCDQATAALLKKAAPNYLVDMLVLARTRELQWLAMPDNAEATHSREWSLRNVYDIIATELNLPPCEIISNRGPEPSVKPVAASEKLPLGPRCPHGYIESTFVCGRCSH